jgi:predicted Zn-dependent protease
LGGISDPHDADQLLLAGRLINQHQNQRALELLTDLCTRYPESPVIHARLGRVYSALGFPEDAVKSYRRSVTLDPSHGETWAELSVALVWVHQMEEAQKTLEEALKLEPKSAFCWGAYGIYCGNLNAVAETIRCFEKAVELDPQNGVYWGYLAKARELNGDAKGAAAAKARAQALMSQTGPSASADSSAAASIPPSHSGLKIGTWEKP